MRLFNKISLAVLFAGLSTTSSLAGETAILRNGFSIHYERREALGEVTRLYIAESAESFVDVPTNEIVEVEHDAVAPAAPKAKAQPHSPRSRVNLDEALSAASQHNNVSPGLLRSVVRAESAFNPKARSKKGAQGLMQLMPETAARMGVKDAMDPAENLEGGARYLRELLGRYHNDLPIALAAYNAGPERVEQYHGIPPYRETVAYVNRVLRGLQLETSDERQSTPAGYQLPDGQSTKEPDASGVTSQTVEDLEVPSANSPEAGDRQ